MTTYTVFRSNDSSRATSRLTLEEAARELLTQDGHDYEIKEGGILSDGTQFYCLYVTQFSRNSPLGNKRMVRTNIYGLSKAKIYRKVIMENWHGMEAMTDIQYDQMLADLEQETEE
jgi:hypothetical protein